MAALIVELAGASTSMISGLASSNVATIQKVMRCRLRVSGLARGVPGAQTCGAR